MSERTLRVLVAFGFVFSIFIYVLSTQVVQMVPVKSPEEGKLGGPLPGLTRPQLARFEAGRALFRKKFGIREGLGPLYNGESCAECHGGTGITGGAGKTLQETSITLFAKKKSATPASAAAEPPCTGTTSAESAKAPAVMQTKDLDYMVQQGGPMLLRKSITDLDAEAYPNCKIEPLKTIPKDADFHGRRYASQLYGLGLVDAIPDLSLRFEAGKQGVSKTGIHGKPAQGRAIFSDWATIGRFGAKAQEASLMGFVAQELGTQLGISNQICRHTITNSGLDKIPDCLKSGLPADPNDDNDLSKITFYLQTLAPPPRGEITPAVTRGEEVFKQLNCAVCHLPEYKTGPKIMVINPDGTPIRMEEVNTPFNGPALQMTSKPMPLEVRSLEKRPVNAYSDFLLHDMGPGLSDGIAQAGTTSSEWRTTPLWGLRYRNYYLHDGRAKSIGEAIALHGGEATDAQKAASKLTPAERDDLMAFLNSL